ncbi:MAG: Phage conserved hypothetical protein [Cyanobacteriota bacterium]|jgi:Phage conserved hypothetical protein BR0599
MINTYKYAIFKFPDNTTLRLADYGSSVDALRDSSNFYSCQIAHAGIEASALEMPRSLEASNLSIKLAFDDLAYPIMSKLLRDHPTIAQTPVTVGFSLNGDRQNTFYGYISDSSYTDVGLTLSLESVLNIMTRGKVFKTGNSCRWSVLGGADCGADMNVPGRKFSSQITAIAPDRYSFNYDSNIAAGSLALGAVKLELANKSVIVDIISNTTTVIFLFERLPLIFNSNDTVELTIGCNRSAERCKEFSNFTNFGGSPTGEGFLINARKVISGTKDYTK